MLFIGLLKVNMQLIVPTLLEVAIKYDAEGGRYRLI